MTANGSPDPEEFGAPKPVGADAGPAPADHRWWARLRVWQLVVAPLVTVLLAAGATAIVGDVFASDPGRKPMRHASRRTANCWLN
jgi:hypothetical protein